MATLKEIAQRAGVSITTVSHVLNGTRPVSTELKKRVLEAMEALGVEPRFPTRKRSSQLVAMLIDDIFNPFFTEVFAAAEATARSMGYHLLLLHSIERGSDLLYLRDLEEKSVDGLIVATRLGIAHLKKAFSTKLPMVFLGGSFDVPFSTSVFLPDKDGAYLATKHLLELGHRDILCLGGPAKFSLFRERFEGYVKALTEWDLAPNPQLMVEMRLTFEEAYRFGREFLGRAQGNVTAVFTHNDPSALGILKARPGPGDRRPSGTLCCGF